VWRTRTAGPAPLASAPMEVGFAGLGIMGSRMAANLRDAGHDVVVWNRTRAKADAFGGPVADSPHELASRCDVLITMLVDGPDVEAVARTPSAARGPARCSSTCPRSRRGWPGRSAPRWPSATCASSTRR
jgi:hypothetical protein